MIAAKNVFTISLIIIRVGPIFLWIRKTSKNFKYITSKERENMRLATVNVSEGRKWRTHMAAISKEYDNKSTTFQKSYKYLFILR